jgi:hypothetical protein
MLDDFSDVINVIKCRVTQPQKPLPSLYCCNVVLAIAFYLPIFDTIKSRNPNFSSCKMGFEDEAKHHHGF